MHQKVQIHSVFLIHKKLQFVNASLGGNKMSILLINTYTNAPGRSARPSAITDWLPILLYDFMFDQVIFYKKYV